MVKLVEQMLGSASASYVVWIVLSIVSGLLSTLCVHAISTNAAGSGIPEMKSILSGVLVSRYLSIATWFAKVLGLVAALNAGASATGCAHSLTPTRCRVVCGQRGSVRAHCVDLRQPAGEAGAIF